MHAGGAAAQACRSGLPLRPRPQPPAAAAAAAAARPAAPAACAPAAAAGGRVAPKALCHHWLQPGWLHSREHTPRQEHPSCMQVPCAEQAPGCPPRTCACFLPCLSSSCCSWVSSRFSSPAGGTQEGTGTRGSYTGVSRAHNAARPHSQPQGLPTPGCRGRCRAATAGRLAGPLGMPLAARRWSAAGLAGDGCTPGQQAQARARHRTGWRPPAQPLPPAAHRPAPQPQPHLR